jgi:hypothetical protein
MSSEEEVSVKSIELPQARLFFDLTEKKEVSYKDLYQSFLEKNGVHDSEGSSDESESENYSYPAFMQRIIERLDKYGQLASLDQIGMHKNDPRKKRKIEEKEDNAENLNENPEQEESEDICDMYYDLSDNFIDDTDLQNGNNDESDISKAINEGFYTLTTEEYLKSLPKTPKKSKKSKEKKETPKVDFQKKPDVDISHLSKEIKDKLDELRKLYEQKRKEGNTAPFPKGTAQILEKIVPLIENTPMDLESMFNNISSMSSQNTDSVKVQFEKTKKKIEKNAVYNKYLGLMKTLKKKITTDVKWNNNLRGELCTVLDALEKYVNVSNNSSGPRGKKNLPLLNYSDEEKKIINELKKLSNGLVNIDLKAELIDSDANPHLSDTFEKPELKLEDFEVS